MILSDIEIVQNMIDSDKELAAARRPDIINIAITGADEEFDWTPRKGVKRLLITTRDSSEFRFSFFQGRIASSEGPLFTIVANSSYDEDNLVLDEGITFYFAAPATNKVIEILMWF